MSQTFISSQATDYVPYNPPAAKRRKTSYLANRRAYKKASYRRRLIVNPSKQIHQFKRLVVTDAAAPMSIDLLNGFYGTTNFNMELAFTLDGMIIYLNGGSYKTVQTPNSSEFKNLYDQYRIDKVKLKFLFSNNSSSVNSPGTVLPNLYYTTDYDDANGVSLPDIQQYGSTKVWQMGSSGPRGDNSLSVTVYPKVDMNIYAGVTNGYAPANKSVWLDTIVGTVPHYGFKMVLDPVKTPGVATVVGYMNIIAEYYLSCKHTK